MKKRLKIIFNILTTLIIALAIVIAIATIFSVFDVFNLPRLYVVQSGSMSPTISTGSIAVTDQTRQNSSDLKVGDIITFSGMNEDDIPITHRIVEITEDNGYITKGDANDSPDSRVIYPREVLGKVLFSIPLLGYPVGFAKTQTGFVLMIAIPATIIVYSELMNVKNEVKKLIAEKKKNKAENMSPAANKKEEGALNNKVTKAKKNAADSFNFGFDGKVKANESKKK